MSASLVSLRGGAGMWCQQPRACVVQPPVGAVEKSQTRQTTCITAGWFAILVCNQLS